MSVTPQLAEAIKFAEEINAKVREDRLLRDGCVWPWENRPDIFDVGWDDQCICVLTRAEVDDILVSRLLRAFRDGMDRGKHFGRVELQRDLRELLDAASTGSVERLREARDA